MKESRFQHKDNQLVQSYLKAFAPFGVSGYPRVFKQEYVPVWDAFKREFKTDTTDKQRIHLYQILMFVLYCNDMDVKVVPPGFKAVKNVSGNFNARAMLDSLYYRDLKNVCAELHTAFVKSRLTQNLQVFKRKTVVVNHAGENNIQYLNVCVLRPLSSRQKIFDILTQLKDSLFKGDVPVQLLPRKHLPSYNDLHNPRTTNGWIAIKTPGVSVYFFLADKEHLVVKTFINIGRFDDVWVPESKKVVSFITKQKIL